MRSVRSESSDSAQRIHTCGNGEPPSHFIDKSSTGRAARTDDGADQDHHDFREFRAAAVADNIARTEAIQRTRRSSRVGVNTRSGTASPSRLYVARQII